METNKKNNKNRFKSVFKNVFLNEDIQLLSLLLVTIAFGVVALLRLSYMEKDVKKQWAPVEYECCQKSVMVNPTNASASSKEPGYMQNNTKEVEETTTETTDFITTTVSKDVITTTLCEYEDCESFFIEFDVCWAETTVETTTETTTTLISTDAEEFSVYQGVGQYGFSINPEEYVTLAQVIEHEGGNCSITVKEHIGICLLNRVGAPGFKDSIWECKEQPGQYFNGYYPYGEESEEVARYLIQAYNSGGEYWSAFCESRGMTWDTKFQRNDYCVPGTTYVTDDYDCTYGGYWFHMYYSR